MRCVGTSQISTSRTTRSPVAVPPATNPAVAEERRRVAGARRAAVHREGHKGARLRIEALRRLRELTQQPAAADNQRRYTSHPPLIGLGVARYGPAG